MIDQNSAEGKALQANVKLELRNYLGKDYNDDVLPLYIVVMLAHGNQQPLVAENLEAFLGQEKASVFADWCVLQQAPAACHHISSCFCRLQGLKSKCN